MGMTLLMSIASCVSLMQHETVCPYWEDCERGQVCDRKCTPDMVADCTAGTTTLQLYVAAPFCMEHKIRPKEESDE